MDPGYQWPPGPPQAHGSGQCMPPQQTNFDYDYELPPLNTYSPSQQFTYAPPQQNTYPPPQQNTYPPPQQNIYPPPQQNIYPSPQQYDVQSVQYPQQPTLQQYQYPSSNPPQPRVVIPPPSSIPQYDGPQDYRPQLPRIPQPQVRIPAQGRNMNMDFNLNPLGAMLNPNPRIRQVPVPAQQGAPQAQMYSRSSISGQSMHGVRVQVRPQPPPQQAPVPRPQSYQSSAPRYEQPVPNASSTPQNQYQQHCQPPQQPPQSQPTPRPAPQQRKQPPPPQSAPQPSNPAPKPQPTPQQTKPAPKPQPTPQQTKPAPKPQPTPQQSRPPPQPSSAPQHRAPSRTPSTQQHTPSSQQRSHPQVVIKQRTPQSAPGHAQARPAHAPPKALPTDLSILLLQSADEYIRAARSLGPVAALAQEGAGLDRYYKLMATAMGCMEATLKNYVLEPRQQATLMFRYASLLIEETENGIEIEETLSKGIALCARSRFLDLKYSFHHLQARYEAKSNLRAALKSLDAPINEAETFQHMVWVYALRFLRVSLALQAPGRAELAGALQQLHAIANQAEKRGDRAVFVTASALEAMIHLRTPGADHLEQAQRAIAAARSYQLEASVKSLGSVGALIDTVDLACSLQKGLSDDRKMHALQQRADKEPGSDDGAFSVLIEKSVGGQSLTQHTGGIIRKVQGGRDELVFYWLPKDDLKILAFYLSGITTVPQELNRGRAYLQEGHRIIADAARRPTPYPLSPPKVIFQRNWIITLDFHLRFALGLSACRAEDEKQAANTLEKLRRLSTSTPFSASDLYSIQVLYLSAVLSQTFGPLSDALQTYAHKELTLTPASTTSPHRHPLHTTLAILATLNHALILRSPTHPSHHLLPSLLSTLETHFPHPSTALTTAHTLIRALTLPPLPLSSTTPTITASALPTLPITQQRKLISSALTASQELKNHHFVVMALAFMAYRFFAESVGDQAVKSVRAVRSVARKQGVLWKVTSAGLCVLVFERNGLVGDAAECKDVVRELGDGLPAELRGVLGWVGVKEEEEDERISG